MKSLKIALVAFMLLPAVAAFAQPGPLTITNLSGCDIQVNAFSHVAGAVNCVMFPTPVFCIPPGGVLPIPPPGGPFDVWSMLNATAYLPSGCALCPSPVNVSSFLGWCAPNPVVAPDGCGCNGTGIFTATWTAGNAVTIN
jgi:hypothetical protein